MEGGFPPQISQGFKYVSQGLTLVTPKSLKMYFSRGTRVSTPGKFPRGWRPSHISLQISVFLVVYGLFRLKIKGLAQRKYVLYKNHQNHITSWEKTKLLVSHKYKLIGTKTQPQIIVD